MQFSARFFAISATLSQVLALPVLTNSAYDVTEGQPFDITWTNSTGSVTLLLKTGASTDLSTYTTIGSGLSGDSFDWTPSNIPSGTYAIAITDGSGETNYSPQFSYLGTGVATTSTSSSSAKSTTASSTTTTDSSTTSTATSVTTTTQASSTVTSLTSSASGSTNGTSTTLSKSTSGGSSATTTGASSTSTPINTNDSQKMGSPLALILLTAAALMFCQ
ncbi:hypothetical protein BD289DRAFT_91470 [Coniella lustricola]|uniref:Ser-Thr-rich glycosyl-phosphatidyl-inositol-anchored membrane family-domain-containing protein n=1 Tax=Coniella lustricola TaxID=2025994 RepID=A0A2T3AH22_9PEZI|nr:hypothetical protein BD289DRAFT_91470 [Coniella lustricola]